MMNLDYIFPTPIWWVDLKIDVQKMQDICYEVASTMEGKARSNRGVLNYQSPDFMGEQVIEDLDKGSHVDEFGLLLKDIKSNALDCYKTFGPMSTELSFANAWININGNGGYNEVHTHPGCVISGVYYVKVPKEGEPGQICFHRDGTDGYVLHSLGVAEDMSTAEVPHTSSTWSYPPVEGRLILFPAWLSHGVRENETNEDRISISFNLVPKRSKQDLLNIVRNNAT